MAVFRCIIDTLRVNKNPLDYNYHNRVDGHLSGLYAFWLSSGACLYVGMGNIRDRIYQHRTSEHNLGLERFFKAFSQQIEVSFIALPSRSESEIQRFETRAIRHLRPLTNIASQNN